MTSDRFSIRRIHDDPTVTGYKRWSIESIHWLPRQCLSIHDFRTRNNRLFDNRTQCLPEQCIGNSSRRLHIRLLKSSDGGLRGWPEIAVHSKVGRRLRANVQSPLKEFYARPKSPDLQFLRPVSWIAFPFRVEVIKRRSSNATDQDLGSIIVVPASILVLCGEYADHKRSLRTKHDPSVTATGRYRA